MTRSEMRCMVLWQEWVLGEPAGCYTDLIALDGIRAVEHAFEFSPEAIEDDALWIVRMLLGALEERDGAEKA